MTDPTAAGGPLLPGDVELLAGLARGNDWVRSLLCTLARRGTWLRHREPQRAAALLQAVAPWPWYKAGQFFFDLLEWEDFMVDGPPPPPFAGDLDEVSLKRLVGVLRWLAAQLDETLPTWEEGSQPGPAAGAGHLPPPADLPPLDAGFYLYQDVVVGVMLAFSKPPGPTGDS